MGLLQDLFGAQSSLSARFHVWLKGAFVGQDALGNRYYTGRPRAGTTQQRRFVIYHGVADPSVVPPEWHGWLHHQTDLLPPAINPHRHHWQLPPDSNRTGTSEAYKPPGFYGVREAATGDYQSWAPADTRITDK
jgi:NADH:ubiquinone oxidoreductase subunit